MVKRSSSYHKVHKSTQRHTDTASRNVLLNVDVQARECLSVWERQELKLIYGPQFNTAGSDAPKLNANNMKADTKAIFFPTINKPVHDPSKSLKLRPML